MSGPGTRTWHDGGMTVEAPSPRPDRPFTVGTRLTGTDGAPALGRTGVLHTPHGDVATPAFIPVGTAATVKTLTPEQVRGTGAQAVLSNAYHLYLQPGDEVVAEAGGLARFMAWEGPTFTDSGGFQVMSLGVGFKKMLAMDVTGKENDDVIADGKERLAAVDDDGVTFTSHRDGSRHRFTPEVSMRIQHNLGADVIFAFDELTTLMNTRGYQEESLERTRLWAERCLVEHERLTRGAPERPEQLLYGVLQGAQYEDLRRKAARDLRAMSEVAEAEGRRGFGGYGLGGAFEKHRLGEMVGWMCAELPEDRPRHMLGISEPDDIFTAVENGADTFDCVAPTRLARRGGIYTPDGRLTLTNARFKRDHTPLAPDSTSEWGRRYTRAYLHHLLKAKEFLAGTICTVINVAFVVALVDDIRTAIDEGRYHEFKRDFLARYYPLYV